MMSIDARFFTRIRDAIRGAPLLPCRQRAISRRRIDASHAMPLDVYRFAVTASTQRCACLRAASVITIIDAAAQRAMSMFAARVCLRERYALRYADTAYAERR